MSDAISTRSEVALIAQRVLDIMTAELQPVLATLGPEGGDYIIYYEGHEVKFRLVSVTEACGYCGGPGVTVGGSPCPVCHPRGAAT